VKQQKIWPAKGGRGGQGVEKNTSGGRVRTLGWFKVPATAQGKGPFWVKDVPEQANEQKQKPIKPRKQKKIQEISQMENVPSGDEIWARYEKKLIPETRNRDSTKSIGKR